MKKHLLALFCLIILAATAFANEDEKGGITGKVTTADGEPAAGVTVQVKGTNRTGLTDDNGVFTLKNVPAGKQILEISLVGYQTTTHEVVVTDKQTVSVTLQLLVSKNELETVVVLSSKNKYVTNKTSSSLRLATPILEVPQNIQVVTAANLADQQVISMSDGLIRNVSGLVRLEHWGDMYTNITARGSQIQAFRNGFNVVASYWGPLTEDMSFVDHIEFVKGPAGFMLSSGEPSGMYNVVTKKPTGQTKGEFSLTMGSWDLYRTTLDLEGKLSKDKRLLYRINLAAQNKKSYRANEYNDRYAIAPVISYQVDDKTKLTFEYNYQRANMSNVGSFYVFEKSGFSTMPVDFTMLPAGTPGVKINDHSLYLNLQHEISPNWKLTAQASRFMYNQEGTSMWLRDTVTNDNRMIRYVGVWDVASTMTMAQAFVNGEVKTGAVNHKILAGLDMSNKEYYADWSQSHDLDTEEQPFRLDSPALGPPVTGYPVFDRSISVKQRASAAGSTIDSRYTSLYVQDEIGFLDNMIRLTLAGRYTKLKQSYYGTQEGERFTPRAGISVSIDKNTAAYALYDQAFTPQTGVLLNGGKVKPLTGNNMELGIKKNWLNGRWNTTLAVYRILKENELVSLPKSGINPDGIFSVELGQKRAQGVEFDLRGTIVNGLNLVANYAFTEAVVTKVSSDLKEPSDPKVGDLVPNYAKHTANTWLNYRLQSGALKGFGVSAGFTWLIGRVTYWEPSPDPNQQLKDYFKLDAGLNWANEKVKINLNVFNLLDKYLYSGTYDSYAKAYSWQTDPPRNVRLSIAYSF